MHTAIAQGADTRRDGEIATCPRQDARDNDASAQRPSKRARSHTGHDNHNGEGDATHVAFCFDLDPELVALVAIQADRATRPMMARVSHAWRHGVLDLAPALARTAGLVQPSEDKMRDDYSTCLAARGWTNVLRWAHDQGLRISTNAYVKAIRCGQFETLKWLAQRDRPARRKLLHSTKWGFLHQADKIACAKAARAGRLDILEWLRCETPDQCQELAEALGMPDAPAESVARWVAERQKVGAWEWDERTCTEAARGGHIDVLKWALANGCPHEDRAIYDAAARSGRLDVVEWVHAQGMRGSTHLWEYAVRSGSLDMLRWIDAHNADHCVHPDVIYYHDKGIVCTAAVRIGRIDILEWARTRGCAWTPKTCAAAAGAGHINVLVWLRARGCPWNESTCKAAARGGHFDILWWARANGCPWDARTFKFAAATGRLDVLQRLRADACPWDAGTCSYAASRGHLDVLRWLRANGCPWDEDACSQAVRGGHLDTLVWLHAHGCPWMDWWCLHNLIRATNNTKMRQYVLDNVSPCARQKYLNRVQST
ncbi:Ankyrin repeat domain containing protein [Pandoravirus salinus]|uniref:Ankyrin repeat domain containing protein n=1 Tax=Pandoravirus salinus TaxID=1349410 RepID=S4W2J1_9VIRU|nr:ankyrin repeat domain [Pandoravirus salinus]AGO84727.1 Ankyrin repeat domain containing protein [Pandoravirus salinus]